MDNTDRFARLHRRMAFTFLELLTVVSILSLLAAIMFPALVDMKRLAIRESCQANLHQIGFAFALYESDFDDYYPAAIDRYTRDHPDFLYGTRPPIDPEVDTIPDLVISLSPYGTSSTSIWRCPADLDPFQRSIDERLTDMWYPSVFSYAGTSYAFWPAEYFARSVTSLKEADFRLCRDTYAFWHSESNVEDWTWKANNYLFGDGHVRYIFNGDK